LKDNGKCDFIPSSRHRLHRIFLFRLEDLAVLPSLAMLPSKEVHCARTALDGKIVNVGYSILLPIATSITATR